MKTRNAFILILFILSSSIIPGCSKTKDDNNNCISYSNSPVTKIEGPNTAHTNEDIALTVTYGLANGCGEFDHFEKTTLGNTTTVYTVGIYTGCICTQVYKTEQTVYNFKATSAGTYYLKFLQGNDTALMDTIVVQ